MAETSGRAIAYLSPEKTTAQSTPVLVDTLSTLEPGVTHARDKGCRVHTPILEGPPGPVLVTESKGAAMLVLGQRGHGALVRLLIGVGVHDVQLDVEQGGLVDRPAQCRSGGTGVVDAADDAAGRHGSIVSRGGQSKQSRRSRLPVDSGPAAGLVTLRS
jgi:hypothetical protein